MQKKIEIVYCALDELHPDPKNPRRNDGAVSAVMESIREFGFRVPIVIDKDFIIRAGHTRYKAAQELHLTKVPCVVVSDLSDKELKAFQLADNKTGELASWDTAMLSLEMTDLAEIFDMSLFGFEKKKDDLDNGIIGGSDGSDSASSKYIACPRCGKIFLKSEGHPKTSSDNEDYEEGDFDE